MTIAASGPLRATVISTEYGGTGPMRIGTYRRGHAAGWVKANAAGNSTTNLSAGVPLSTAPLRMANFRSQAKGWTYTNTTIRTNGYLIETVFGTDWDVAWPKAFINNAVMGSSVAATYACIIDGPVGGFTFTNNAEIQGWGGAANSGAGYHGILIRNTVAGADRPIIINNSAIRGGGGGGGKGGTGGRGGAGHYLTYEPGPGNTQYSYARDSTTWRVSSASVDTLIWAGTVYYNSATNIPNGYLINSGAAGGGSLLISDFVLRETYGTSPVYNGYGMRKQNGVDSPAGGLGGAGGNGGIGQGYNNAAADAGVAGANGAAGTVFGGSGGNSGAGGKGGTGGTGGAWATAGATGATGLTGAAGTNSVPPYATAGAAGVAGGARGYAINATSPWGLSVTGTLSGSYTGTAPT